MSGLTLKKRPDYVERGVYASLQGCVRRRDRRHIALWFQIRRRHHGNQTVYDICEDAAFFAQNILFPLDQKPLTIVEVEIPDSLVSRLFHFTTDGKITIAVERHLLSEFNAAAGIQPLHFASLPTP